MHRCLKLVVTTTLALTTGQAIAQTAPVPPPPDIGDPGVKAVPVPVPVPTPPPKYADQAARASSVPPGTPVHVLPAPASTVLSPEATPEVTIREEGDDSVQEYRVNGRLYMIRVVPKHGIPQTYIDSDGDGRLERPVGTRRGVAPVYYTLYQWDKPQAPAEATSTD